MSSFDGLIKLEVKIDPKNQAEQQLKQIVNNLSKLKINLSLDSNINSQLKQVSDNINKIYSNSNKKITLGDISKSAEESAKVFEGISEQIGKIRELSERKIKENNALQEAKEVNSALEEQYKLEQQMANIRSKADYNSKQREIQEQNQLNKTLEDEEKLINEIANKREQSSKTQKNIDNKNELNQAKAINKVLEDNYKASLKEVEAQKQVEAEIQKQIKLLEIKKQGILSKNSKADTSDIDNAITKYKQLNNLSMKDLRNEILYTNAELKNSSTSADSFISKLGKSLSNFGFYINIGDIIRGVFNSFKDGVQVVMDIDTAMRDLAKVSSATTEQLAKFPQIANQIAIETGTSSEAIIKATEYYSKLGYAISEASERAKNATIFANVADMNIDDASKSLITIAKGFDLNKLEDMTRIMDVANAVGNNFSSTSQNIAEGLRRSGNAMSEAGNSYEQSVGLFVSANASIQDAETVGNAIKTITMRLRGMKTEIDETGIPVSKLRQAIKDVTATTGQTVDIMKDDNTFKSTYDIMNELAGVYPKLTDAQRSYLQYVIAGQRQGNIFSGMMNNMKEGVDAYTTALGASGSAMKEQQIYMNSIEGKTNALKETSKKFWVDSINSNTVKGFVDGLTSLISTFGNLQTVVAVATTALLLFKGSAILEAITPIFAFGSSLVTLTTEFGATAVASDLLSVSMTKLSAIASANPFGVIALACTGAVLAIQKVNSELDKVNDKITPLNESLSDLSNIKSNEDLVKQYEDLEKVINSNTSSTEEISSAKERLLQVQKQIASNMPELITGYTAEGEAIATNVDKIKAKISNDLNGTIKQAQSSYKDLFDQLNSNNVNGFARYNNTYDKRTQIEEYQELLNKQGEWTDKESERYTELNKKISSMNQAVMQLQSNGQDVSGMKIFDFETGKLVDAKQYIDDMAKSSDNAKGSADNLANGIDNIGNSADNASTDFDKLAEAFNNTVAQGELVDKVLKEMSENDGLSLDTWGKVIKDPEILQALSDQGTAVEKLTALRKKDTDEIQNKIDKAIESADVETNNYDITTSAKEESDDRKSTSDTNTQNNIQDKNTETTNSNLQNYDTDTNNFASGGESKISANDIVNSAIGSANAGLVNGLANVYEKDVINFGNAQNAKLQSLIAFQNQVGQVAGGAVANIGVDVAKTVLPSVSEISVGGYNKVGASNPYDKVGSSGASGSKGSGSKGKSDAEKAQKELEKYQEQLENLNSEIETDRYFEANNALTLLTNSIDDLKSSQEGLTGNELAESKKKEIELIYKQMSATQELIRIQGGEKLELQQKLINNKMLIDSNGQLINSQQRLKEMQDEINSRSYDATEDGVKKKKEDIEALKELQNQVNKYTTLVNSEIPKNIKSWDDLNSSLKEINDSMNKIYQDTVSDLRDKIIEGLKADIEKEQEKEENNAKKIYDKKLKNKDKEIQQLQDELNSLDDSKADNEKKLAKLIAERNAWAKDDSVFAKGKIKNLDEQIADLQKTLNKEDLQSQIDDLNEEKNKIQDTYDEEVEATKDKYENMLDEHEIYNRANKLLQDKNITEIQRLMKLKDESFKDIGLAWGENLCTPIQEQINQTLTAIDNLKNKTVGNNTNSDTSGEKSNSSSKNYAWIDEGAYTQVFTDSTGTESKGSLWQNGYGSADKLVQGTDRQNGFYEMFDTNGKSIGWVDAEKIRKWYDDIEQYDTGGRVPDNVSSNGVLAKLDKGEKILTKRDTDMLDKNSDTLDELGKFVKSDALQGIFDLANSIKVSEIPVIPNNISIPTSTYSGMDFRNVTNNSNTNNNSNSTEIQMINNIHNYDPPTTAINERTMERVVRKVLKDDKSRFGGKK